MKKGFTLIELLAVIVILAVIAVIATPIIIGVIDNSKKSSYINSAHGILDAANKMVMKEDMNNNLANNYQIDLTSSTLSYSGKKPSSGTLLIDRLQNVSFTLKYDNYCIEKKFDESEPTIKDKEICIVDSSELSSSLQYKEKILNGTDPVINGDLIPVIIEADGIVKKSSINEKYYSYSDKIWANAVILLDKNINYNVGDTIPESNIESYFVWIPRYRYQLFNTNNVSGSGYLNKEQTINIVFENKNTIISSGTSNGTWLTHPSFIAFNSNGMWVGKFETGYKGATSPTSAQSNTIDSTKVIIKPNAYSWRSIQPAKSHQNSYNYNRTLDSHMMKNTEWGAVAYLSHSDYGINSNIRINNNSLYLTGYSKTEEPTCGYTNPMSTCNAWGGTSDLTLPYNTEIGFLASTTGNISGIYDMAGGANEYVMAVRVDSSGNPVSGRNATNNSGFNGNYSCPTCDGQTEISLTTGINFPDTKYYDKYTSPSYNARILGDSTGELGPYGTWSFSGISYSDGITITNGTSVISSWNKDRANFADDGYPWFLRGGAYTYGEVSGIFNFSGSAGMSNSGFSYRIILQ